MTQQDKREIRLRFAPSPTGYLHVGGARTALYNWLYARKMNGTFVLRIEDTDVQRSSQEMVDVILNSMQWLGLNWDEGPFYQSQRLDLYRQAAHGLLESGKAYRCFCKPEELESRRNQAIKEKGSWKYERLCLQLPSEEIDRRIGEGLPFAVRFLVPQGRTTFDDLVHKEISLSNETIDDFVLLRSDGFPTYHLSVVVDDIDMRISHIIRGDDHISNTPKQVMLYGAFGKTPPAFAHVPLILGPDKKRLSKRHGSVAVEEYRNQGIIPEALVNFLALLGWNPGDDRELFFMDELIREFRLERVGSSNAVFDVKKLQWMNAQYISRLPLQRIKDLVEPQLENKEWMRDPSFDKRFELMRSRAASVAELAESLVPFYRNDFPYDAPAFEKHRQNPDSSNLLEEFARVLEIQEEWKWDKLESALRAFVEARQLSASALIHPVRLAVSGKTKGPGLFELLEAMGKQNSIERIRRLASELKKSH